jgi:hypothetical protein
MTTFNWTIATLEYDLQPSDMDGAVIVAHWRVNAEETTGEGDDAVTYTASSYGTCGFSPDPAAPGYVPYADLTRRPNVLGLVWTTGVDKDATEASLQANIDLQINPVTASGVPW